VSEKLWRYELPLETEDELRHFVEKAWGVEIPDVQVCDNHSTPWRAFADAYFCRGRLQVWKASRGFGGKSFLLALLGLTEAATLKCDVNILGGSGEQSQNVHAYMQEFWDTPHSPRQLLASDPSKTLTRLSWGNKIKALTASQRSVRGPHIPRLRLDEIDEMDLAIMDAALGQPMSRNGVKAQTVQSSTHQHPDGTMTEALARAQVHGFPVHEWCWRESVAEGLGWLSPDEVEEKKLVIPAVMWDTEYELQEPNPESRAIDTAKVKAMFSKALGEALGQNGEYLEFEAPVMACDSCRVEFEAKSREEGSRCPKCRTGEVWTADYSTGADWARKRDRTAIVTCRYDVEPARIVAFEQCNRLPWPTMVDKLNARLTRFPGRAAHDATGVGDVVAGFLTVGATPVVMSGRPRTELLTTYIGAIEKGEYVSPWVAYMEAEHRLCSVDDLFGSGHAPDTIVAGAMMHRARTTGWVLR